MTHIEPGDDRPVFNLVLEKGHTFFVGASATLVHDGAPIRESD